MQVQLGFSFLIHPLLYHLLLDTSPLATEIRTSCCHVERETLTYAQPPDFEAD